MIVPHAEIRERVLALHKAGGLPRGSSTGWPSLDALYTVGLGQWTCVTGNPNSGKSEFIDALLVNLAKREEWKFYLYSPENWPLEVHHAKILEKYLGKPFNPGPTPRMEADEVEAGEAWMADKFFFCRPDKPTIQGILAESILHSPDRKAGDTWKMGLVVDPWNQLEHQRPAGYTETEYVSKTLTEVIEHVRAWSLHLWLIAHPAKLYREKDGKFPIPTPRDISGSVHFWNKADNCLCVHRDLLNDRTNDVEILVQKCRFKHIGRIGSTTLSYDRVTGRYREPLQSVRSYKDRDE